MTEPTLLIIPSLQQPSTTTLPNTRPTTPAMLTPRVREPTPHIPVIAPTLLLIKEHCVKPPQPSTHHDYNRRQPTLITKPQKNHKPNARRDHRGPGHHDPRAGRDPLTEQQRMLTGQSAPQSDT
jgi:hypothetical protein